MDLRMDLNTFLDRLGYSDAPTFLRRDDGRLESAVDVGHVFRHAKDAPCNLQGVYTLTPSPDQKNSCVPVVYVCHVADEETADKVHRLVWNQDVAPFVLLHTPRGFKLYSGFHYRRPTTGASVGVLKSLTAFNAIADLVEDLGAESIDSGRIWKSLGSAIRPEKRVDWQLLENLRKLDAWLRRHGLEQAVSHALIGKYVFLHYLLDRNILSDRKLETWGIAKADVFGRNATIRGLGELCTRLDDWLNGGVFPLKLRGPEAPTEQHVQRVAAAFHGDSIEGDELWQLHLDFQAYDFSYIPIETLSVIYEQFLHAPTSDGRTRGREAGAYYTPIPVVNFMLSELEERRPLQRGRTLFDPSCGSGAFLVQAYRRLIEKEFPPTDKTRPTPGELRDLLTDHFFGADRDADACSVTELSLILTLLDYVEPPDLEGRRDDVRMPELRGKNVLHADLFDKKSASLRSFRRERFEVIIGNPPWKSLNPKKLTPEDQKTWAWMAEKKDQADTPIGGNQAAQAFVWRIRDFAKPDCEVALLLPAMTLFENRSCEFRSAFFRRHRVHSIANFANLAEVLFAGRSRVPAAVFFFVPLLLEDAHSDSDHANVLDSLAKMPHEPESETVIETFSPLVANQEATRPIAAGQREESWSLVINASEIRDVPQDDAASGSGLTWKLAMWGSERDRRLLRRLEKRFDTLGDLEKKGILLVSQGLELREKPKGDDGEAVDLVKDVVGKKLLDVDQLEGLRHVFTFPRAAIVPVPDELRYARKGRAELPLKVCQPPHVIVSAARNFAVFTDKYLVVPPRQIGIVSIDDDSKLLKAISVYLSSDFAFYHQFLTATQFGVQRGLSTLNALRRIPIPIGAFTDDIESWLNLHSRLAATEPRRIGITDDGSQPQLQFDNTESELEILVDRQNEMVNNALGLADRERALIHDLVHVKLELNDGKCGRLAVDSPTVDQMRVYARRLKGELDGFLGDEAGKWHQVAVVFEQQSGMIQIDLLSDRKEAAAIQVLAAEKETARQLVRARDRLRKQFAQWVYFDRNLRLYEGRKTYLFKPMQRFHWTESQAMQDASEIIAETLSALEDEP